MLVAGQMVALTGHRSIDSANICEQGYLGQLNSEHGGFDHLVF